ncbi:MAG TPA: BON domain-containing protein [Gaiellaceae bacterium]|nr:BON domain-containing protein [Gaiellaceae bacterium]
MKKFGLAALIVAVGAWFATDQRRRAVVFGRVRELVGKTRPKQYDDATLKDKVESELFRDEHEVKGSISVNAQEGIVQLRGELPSQDLIDALVERTHQIHGVRGVESLLHLPGTEAPMHN